MSESKYTFNRTSVVRSEVFENDYQISALLHHNFAGHEVVFSPLYVDSGGDISQEKIKDILNDYKFYT